MGARPHTATDPASADERVQAADGVDERDRDDRQRQLVGEHPLVEVGREADDERHEPRPEQRRGQGIVGEPDRAAARRPPPPTATHDQRPPVDAPARRSCSSSCSGQRVGEPVGARSPSAPAGASEPRRAASSVRQGRGSDRPGPPCPVSRPGAGERQLDERGVRHAGRAARRRTGRPCGSRPCRRCRGGPTAPSRTRAGTGRS